MGGQGRGHERARHLGAALGQAADGQDSDRDGNLVDENRRHCVWPQAIIPKRSSSHLFLKLLFLKVPFFFILFLWTKEIAFCNWFGMACLIRVGWVAWLHTHTW